MVKKWINIHNTSCIIIKYCLEEFQDSNTYCTEGLLWLWLWPKFVPEKNCHFFAFFSLTFFIWRRMKIWLAVSFFEREGPFWFGSVGVFFWYCSVWHRCCGWLFVDFLHAKNFKIPTLIVPRAVTVTCQVVFCYCSVWCGRFFVFCNSKLLKFVVSRPPNCWNL